MRIPYDKLWKAMVTAYFHDFLEMFLPELFEQTNLDIPPKFLEQELHAALTDKTIKVADKLVQVTLKSGEEKWVYVHIEFETDPKKNIGERMFGYYQRIAAKYGRSITAIVIYTGDRIPKISDLYEEKNFGTRVLYEFNTYKIKEQNEMDLINNPNPFAVFVLANLYVIKTRNNDAQRLTFKEKVYEIAALRNYSREKISQLLIFVLELIQLKPASQQIFDAFINNSKKNNEMDINHIVTDISRNHVNVLTKGIFGESYAELQTKRDNAIVKFYAESKKSIIEIAEMFEVEAKYVRKVLKARDLL